ncbi:MAG: hypothetical protein LN415_02180 [Candidatus Thermoplasmatota archaeon]|nr:hypothetical protein [Candidatus Thermoplasmatota archaeon]
MRNARFLSMAVLTAFLLSATTVALPRDVGGPQVDGDLGLPGIQSGLGGSLPLYSSNPNSSWTHKLNHTGGFSKTTTNASLNGTKITYSGMGIGGDFELTVKGIFKNANLEIEVSNLEVGGSLTVNVVSNPFLQDLKVNVGGNKVGGDLHVLVEDNAVSNLEVNIGENRACLGMMVQVIKNSIDYQFLANFRKNVVKDDMILEINQNHRPPGWPELFHTMTVFIVDNHVVQLAMRIYIQQNDMAKEGFPKMYIEIRVNGAGTDMWTRILANRAYPTGEIEVQMHDNACDVRQDIFIFANKALEVKVNIVRNYGCGSSYVAVQDDAVGPIVKEPTKCMQQTGGDGDGDGLTDLYELMVGTYMTNPDTDGDGIWDGWHDKNKNKVWDGDERHGEIGDPDHPAQKFSGSVDRLVRPPEHEPNPICCDIYVEIDQTKGQKKFPKQSVDLLQKKFKKHRIKIHIDNGWPGKGGGGQTLPAKLDTHKGTKFLHFRQLLGAKNDFYDFKEKAKYFDPMREDIFHYAIIGPYISYEAGGSMVYNKNVTGIAEKGGDDFALAGKAIDSFIKKKYVKKDWKSVKPKMLARSLMHELGHNMDLLDTYAKADEPLTVMYGYISTVKPLDYKQSAEWAALRPDKVIETSD